MREKEIKVTELYHKYLVNNNYKVVVQVGGRFSGKSHNEQVRLVANLATKQDYKLLVIEDLETGMADGFHAGLRDRIDDFEHASAYNPRSRTAYIKNEINGNQVLFRGYITDQQKLNVKKLSGITEILVEESEWVDYDSFIGLLQQLRGGREEDRKLTFLMNPVNEYCFVNEMLIQQPPDKVLEYFPGTNRPKVFEKNITTKFTLNEEEITQTIVVLVVISTHYDNSFLTLDQRASIETLRTTDPDKYKQLGEARFIKSGGSFFSEFSRDTHVIKPFVIPFDWRKYFVMDYGLDMLAGYWIAQDNQGKCYVYKEVHQSDLIISDAANKIKELTTKEEKIFQHLAPPDLWNRRQETGKSAAEIFQENGLFLTKTDNNRVQGWLDLKEWLKLYEDEQGILTANLQIFENCTNLIRTLSQVKRCEKNPNDVAKEPHELTHAPDAIRGFVRGRPIPYKAPIAKQYGVNPYKFATKKQTEGGLITW